MEDRGGKKQQRAKEEEEEEEVSMAKKQKVGEEEQYEVLFRSYAPRDVKLQALRRAQSEVPDLVREIAERVAQLTAQRHDDVLSLAPKKAAWDLARDLQPKLARLAHKLDLAVVAHLKQQQQQQ